MDQRQRLDGAKIGMYGKGGSGKSTVTVLLARALQASGYTTCILDADSTNVGLAEALGAGGEPRQLIDYFGGWVFSGGSVTCPVDDPSPLRWGELDLESLPAEYVATSRDGITLLTAGKITGRGPGAGCDGPVVKVARDLRFRKGGVHPVTLIDFKAGFEDTARGTVTGIDWGIIVLDPTTASLDLARQMATVVAQIRAGELPQTQHLDDAYLVQLANRIYRNASISGLAYVLNRVPSPETAEYMRSRLAEADIVPDATFADTPELAAQWLRGEPLDDSPHREEALRLVGELESRAAVREEHVSARGTHR